MICLVGSLHLNLYAYLYQNMAIGKLAVCYNDIEVFWGVVKVRHGEILWKLSSATVLGQMTLLLCYWFYVDGHCIFPSVNLACDPAGH